MNGLVVLPIAIPLATAIIGLFCLGHSRTQKTIAIAGAAALLVAALLLLRETWVEETLVLQSGGWPAPFGITLISDMFAAIMVTLAAIMGLAGTIFSAGTIDRGRERYGFYPLVHMLLMGVCGAFLTGDLFNLYVWFEVLLVSSFVLLVLGGRRPQLEGAIKYVGLNLLASALFLTGIGLLYASAGTLNMADLSVKLADATDDGYITAVAMLFLVAFGLKAAMFPLFFWLPASYHTAPAPVAALFAGLLTKVGVYALIRMFTLVFTQDVGFTHEIILWLSLATMITGVLGTVTHYDIKRILSFHIISQIGYMTLGLALYTPLALAAAIYYIAHNIVVKANLFLVAGAVRRLGGSYHVYELGGFYRHRPILAVLFFLPAFSLAGIPPLSGFFAKFAIVQAAADEQQYLAIAVALGVGFLTLYSMTKIWIEAFLTPAPEVVRPLITGRLNAGHYIPVVFLVVVMLIMSFAAEPMFQLAQRAADGLMDTSAYTTAVLGEDQQ